MGYSLPLRFVKVSAKRSDNRQFDVAICATRIVAMMSTDIYQARRTLTAEKKAGSLINAAGIEKAKTAIFLDNGSVVASPLSVRRLMTLIEKSNEKASPNKTKRMEVYSVYDPEPEETDEYEEEIDAYYGEVEDDDE